MPRAVPYRVCFVCSGNICRSPMAEAVLRRMVADAGLADRVTVSSAGIGGWHAGDGADPRAMTALRRRGYFLDHAARQWRPVDCGDLDVPDPYYGGARGFERVLDLAEAACAGILAEIQSELEPA